MPAGMHHSWNATFAKRIFDKTWAHESTLGLDPETTAGLERKPQIPV